MSNQLPPGGGVSQHLPDDDPASHYVREIVDPQWYEEQKAARVKGLVALAKVHQVQEIVRGYLHGESTYETARNVLNAIEEILE